MGSLCVQLLQRNGAAAVVLDEPLAGQRELRQLHGEQAVFEVLLPPAPMRYRVDGTAAVKEAIAGRVAAVRLFVVLLE